MKIGANAPCPCGSGKKYKKCCRKLKRPGPPTLGAAQPPAKKNLWPPLRKPLPKNREFHRKDFQRCFTIKHVAYIRDLQQDMNRRDPKISQKGLDKMEIIPMEQMLRVPFLSSMRSFFLHNAGHAQEAREFESALLLNEDSEEHWMVSGKKLLPWVTDLGEEEGRPLLDSLRKMATKASFPQPKLVLTQILAKFKINEEEQMQLLSEVLLPIRWKNQGEGAYLWLKEICQGFCSFIYLLKKYDQLEKAKRYARMSLSYPWLHKLGEFTSDELKLFSKSLASVGCYKEQIELSQLIVKKQVSWWWPYFNLGNDARSKNNFSLALKYYRKTLDIGGYDQDTLLSIASVFMSHTCIDDLKRVLELLDDKEDIMYIFYSLFLKDIEQDYEGGIELCNKGLELSPLLFFLSLYKAEFYVCLKEFKKARSIFNILLDDELLYIRRKAVLGLCNILDFEKKSEESLKLMQNFLSEEDDDSEEDDEWQYSVNLQTGVSMRVLNRYQESLEHLLVAKSFKESKELYFEMIATTLVMERFDEAEAFLNKTVSDFDGDDDTSHLRLKINEGLELWEENSLLVDRLGLDWFRENEVFRQGITFKIAALLNLNKPFEALKFCEDILEEILEDEELKKLRRQAFREANARYRESEKVLGTHTSKLKQMKETRELLAEQIRKNRHSQNSLKKSLNNQKLLEQELGQLRNKSTPEENQAHSVVVSPKPFETLKKQYPQICKILPKHLMKILISSELLWNKLSEHPDHDHGPVVLQLARVVEGMVNKTMIDPLVKRVLNMGIEISELNSISGGLISKSLNRLSMGECAHLLQGPKITRGPTDAQQVEINIRSTENHKKILNALWNNPPFSELSKSTLYYLKNNLPWDLRKLAKIRNRAGHAGQIISRDKAKEIRTHVLKKNSLLGQLALIEAACL